MKTLPEKRLLLPGTKMAELVEANFSLLGVLSRLGISFGFGEKTVEQVCRSHGVLPETFLLICRVYLQEGWRPGQDALEKAGLMNVVDYLRRSHSYYTDVMLVSLSEALERLILPCDLAHQRIIRQFFRDYKEELVRHFDYEEQQVFGGLTPFDQDAYEESHAGVKEKLGDLKNLVIKYMPPQCQQQDASRVLFYIYSLEADMNHHTQLEEALLLQDREGSPSAEEEAHEASGEHLSAREKEILVCVAQGMLNKEIADRFGLSIHTVITHRKNITRKTGIKTVAGLTVYALLNGLIDMNSVE